MKKENHNSTENQAPIEGSIEALQADFTLKKFEHKDSRYSVH
jgi:hypothetical protein